MSNSSIFQNPKSGSIKISGAVYIVDVDGKVLKTVEDPKLCGCGLSQDKPFCDKSHANYVPIVTQMLEMARFQVKAVLPLGIWKQRAFEIRNRTLENRIAAGEKLVGVKFGGALIKEDSETKRYEGIFGYLTDAMEVKETLVLSQFIAPLAEAEVVFKLKQELVGAIELDQVKDFVGEVAAGIEVFDCRYGAIDAYVDDAVADNACSGAFIYGNWVTADSIDFTNVTISISEHGRVNQTVPASVIAGNPWQAVVSASRKLAEAGVKLPAGSIIYSGSATTGIEIKPGAYEVEITNLGKVTLKVS
ncbi:MAG: CDGSH iron-sulfur domain-containing protein [Candidatus Nanopelagicaceae bacterium]